MLGTCSLVASRTAPAAASLSLRPSELVMSELRESVEPSGRAGARGVVASGLGAGRVASQSFPAGSARLVLRGDRGDLIASDAFSATTSGAGSWLRTFS